MQISQIFFLGYKWTSGFNEEIVCEYYIICFKNLNVFILELMSIL